MPKTPVTNVFLDANIVIQEGRKGVSPVLERVMELVDAGLIQVHTTDLTKTEIKKKHVESDISLVKDFSRRHVRETLNEVIGHALPEISSAQLRGAFELKYDKFVDGLFKALNAKTIEIDGVKPTAVLDAYSKQTGFFSGEGKKDQFPDAFIFEALKTVAEPDSPMVIISKDGDFVRPVEENAAFQLLKSIPELFEKLGYEIDAPDVTDFLNAHEEDIRELFDGRVLDSGINVTDVEDVYVEDSTVTLVEFDTSSVFKSTKDAGDILVTGRATLTVEISYSHPDWDSASWDSEDKVAIPHQDVSGTKEVEIETNFAISLLVDSKDEPYEIEDLTLVGNQYGLLASIQDWD